MKKLLIFLILIFLPLASFAQIAPKKAVYFYSATCVHCERVNQYFQDNGIYGKYDIQKYEAFQNQDNLTLLNKYFDAFGILPEKRAYPVIFFDSQMLLGDQDIIDNFVTRIDKSDASAFPTPDSIRQAIQLKNKAAAAMPQPAVKLALPIWLLISAAFVDASNPCALAVLILLLATVIAAKGKNSALLAGLLFSLAIFISYFLMGISLYRAITVFNVPKYLSLGVGIFSILIGLANLKDVFWPGKFFVMEVPMSWRPRMQALLKGVTSPLGAFGVGFLVSLFLVPCASGPYIAILGLLAQKVDTMRNILLLVLYNFVFVLPMLIITFAMYFFNARMGKLEAWRKRNNWLLHSVAGAVMLFIGGYLIYSWLR
jgi:cytochrome c biogenesis protein CcdA/glutaredoxin